MKKRGYFFTVDASIAMIIIVVGFLLIWAFYAVETKKVQSYFYAQDVMDVMSNTRITQVSGTIPYMQALIRDRNITNLDNTLLEQIALSYMEDKSACRWGPECAPYLAKNITSAVITGILPSQYGVTVNFNGTLLYSANTSTGTWQNSSELLVSAKKVVVVVVNKVNLSDPYIMEARVWR